MTNSQVLKELIETSGYKIKFVAEYIGLSTYGFRLKLNNFNEFKTSEVTALCELLNITSLQDKERIFFAQKDDLKSSNKEK